MGTIANPLDAVGEVEDLAAMAHSQERDAEDLGSGAHRTEKDVADLGDEENMSSVSHAPPITWEPVYWKNNLVNVKSIKELTELRKKAASAKGDICPFCNGSYANKSSKSRHVKLKCNVLFFKSSFVIL
jgi:hypothetical protein